MDLIFLEYNEESHQFHHNYWDDSENRFSDEIGTNGWMPVCLLTPTMAREESFLEATTALEAKKASYREVCEYVDSIRKPLLEGIRETLIARIK